MDPKDTAGLVLKLRDQGIPAAAVGELVAAREGLRIAGRTGERPLEYPAADPYWALAAQFSASPGG